MVVYNQIGDTIMVVVNLEELCQTRLTDVETDHYNLLTQQGERDTDIWCHECFTFTWGRRSKQHYLLAFLQHKLNVGTQATEDFLHQVVYILVNHNISLSFLLGSIARHRNVGNDRNLSQLHDVFMSLNLILEEFNQEEDGCWDCKA